MTEGVNSANISYAKSTEERQQMYAEWRKRLTQDDQTNQRLQYLTNKNAKAKSAFLSNADMKERESRFLSNADMAERQGGFVTDDMLPQERPEAFLANDINAERQSVFLEAQRDTQNTQSPLEIRNGEEDEEAQDTEATAFTLPKYDNQIIAELKRDPMFHTLTPQDIANKYNISYQKAMNIYTAANEDENGIVKEFNLPQNATVSYLV